jgi:hypothetical protein
MSFQPSPDELLLEAVALRAAHGSLAAAAEAGGIAWSTLKSRLQAAAERGLSGYQPVQPGFAIKSISTNEGGAWVKQTKAPGEVYQTPPGQAIKGLSTLVDAEGRTIQQWVKTRQEDVTADLATAIKTEFSQYDGYAKLVPPPREFNSDLCTYYPIVDPHLGMLSYGKETGQSNDLGIGIERVQGTLQRLVGLSPASETAVILNTGDFFHADDQRNATPGHGHQLDVDGRNQKVKWAGVNMLRTTIDYALQHHQTIIVKNLKGNHDGESAMWLNIALGLFYSNEPRVQIDPADGNNDHFFHLFGANYTGATHGHTMKPDRMYIMMAEDNPEYWNASLYRWCIFGHIHHETKKTVGSLRCESFSQPVPRDSFAHSHGYRSASAMQSITLHRIDGEQSRQIQNFPPSRGKPVAANDNDARRLAAA